MTNADTRIVAHRSPNTRDLYCVICARQETGSQPATAADTRDDAECTFCGGRVHAVASRTLAEVITRHCGDPTA